MHSTGMIAATILVLVPGATGTASAGSRTKGQSRNARQRATRSNARAPLNSGGGIRPDGRWFLVRGRSEEVQREHRIHRLHAARGPLRSARDRER